MKKVIFGLIGIAVVIIIISAAASSHKSSSSATPSKLGSGTATHPATADVTLTGCSVDDIGFAHAVASITNHSSKTSNYTFEVQFVNSAGTVVAQGAGFESNLAPGQNAQTSAIGDESDLKAPITCQVSDVTRLAA